METDHGNQKSLTSEFKIPTALELAEVVSGFVKKVNNAEELTVIELALHAQQSLVIATYGVAIQLAALRETLENRGANVNNHY